MSIPLSTAKQVQFPSGAVYFDFKGEVVGAQNREARLEFSKAKKGLDENGNVVYTLPIEKVDIK